VKKVVFLHIPKTSGISLKRFFKTAIDGFYLQADSRFQLERQDPLIGRVSDLADIQRILNTYGGLALHVDSSFGDLHRALGFRSPAPILFDPANADYFKQFTILTMMRNPLSRFLSEYASITEKQRSDPSFLPDLEVTTLPGHVERSNANSILHYLLEAEFPRRRQFSSQDLAHVKRCILDYPIHVGIYERYEESIDYFARILDRAFVATDIPRLNVTPAPPPAITPALAAVFRSKNALDFELYEFAIDLFAARAAGRERVTRTGQHDQRS
jgi:hypothetical protein